MDLGVLSGAESVVEFAFGDRRRRGVSGPVSLDEFRIGDEPVEFEVVFVSGSCRLARLGMNGDSALGIESIRDAPSVLLCNPSVCSSADLCCSFKPASLSMLLIPYVLSSTSLSRAELFIVSMSSSERLKKAEGAI
jgi:hypothetical protein